MANLFTYTGEIYYAAETGFYYLRDRYYNPNADGLLRRMDAYKGTVDNSFSIYRYTYTYNNSLRYIDPSGNKPLMNEYAAMIETGLVQEGGGGQTYAAFTYDAFYKQAPNGSVYIEFDVPKGSFVVTNKELGWIKFLSPKSTEAKLAEKRGLPIPKLPEALNIRLKGEKNK